MLKNLLIAISAVCVLASCGGTTNDKTENTTTTDATEQSTTDAESTTDEAASVDGVQFFGEKITADGAVAFEELLAKMQESDSLETKFTGTVESVCKKKGCWVNIVSDDGKEMFVKFKDYGFFLPLDCEGQKVTMEGKAFREVTSVADLQHLAEDGGQSPEEIAKITEPKEELKFMASGVILEGEK